MAKNKTQKWWETKPVAYGEALMLVVIGAIFSYLKLNYGMPSLIALFCIGILLIWKAYKKESILIPVVLILFCILCLTIWQSYFSEPKQLNFATPDELIPSLLQNKSIRINDLVREDNIIRNRTFENCHIYGPAIIALNKCITTQATFTEIDINGVFIETTNKIVSGVIELNTCIIKNCTFHKISFIGTPDDIKRLKNQVINEKKGKI